MILEILDELDYVRMVANYLQDLNFVHLELNLMRFHRFLVDVFDSNDFLRELGFSLVYLTKRALS